MDWVPARLHTGTLARCWYEWLRISTWGTMVKKEGHRSNALQVATFSVYAYFTAALFGRQFLEPRGEHKSVFSLWEWWSKYSSLGTVYFYTVSKVLIWKPLKSLSPATTPPSPQFQVWILLLTDPLPNTHQVDFHDFSVKSTLRILSRRVHTHLHHRRVHQLSGMDQGMISSFVK